MKNTSTGGSNFAKNNDFDKRVPLLNAVSTGDKNWDKHHSERAPATTRRTHGFHSSAESDLVLSRRYDYETEHMLMMMATSTDDRSRQ